MIDHGADPHASLANLAEFSDPEAARLYLERRRWGARVVCPYCSGDEKITPRKARRSGYYRCRDCGREFTVRTGTTFHRSHVPLHKWLGAMHLVVTAATVPTSLHLSEHIGVSQKTAWLMLRRLRQACDGDISLFTRVVEPDSENDRSSVQVAPPPPGDAVEKAG